MDNASKDYDWLNSSKVPSKEAIQTFFAAMNEVQENVSHALRGFYELADILIVLHEVLLLKIS